MNKNKNKMFSKFKTNYPLFQNSIIPVDINGNFESPGVSKLAPPGLNID
jgi:hypothetical protein